MWTRPDKPAKSYPDSKGMESVRRDNAPIASKLVAKTLNNLLMEKSLEKAIRDVMKEVQALYAGTVDLSQLVISKALAKDANDYTATAPHVTLTKRMQKRDLDTAPRMGDRVPFILVARDGNSKKIKTHEKAEDPMYVIQNNVPVDVQYYIDKQLRKPISRLLDRLLPGVTDYLFSAKPCTIYIPPDISYVASSGPVRARDSVKKAVVEQDPKANAPARPQGWTKAKNRYLVGGQVSLFGELLKPHGEKIIRNVRSIGVAKDKQIAGQVRIDNKDEYVKEPAPDLTKPKPGYVRIDIRYRIAGVAATTEGASIGKFGYSLVKCLVCEVTMDATCLDAGEEQRELMPPVCLYCRNKWKDEGKDVRLELWRVKEAHLKVACELKQTSDALWAKCLKCKGVEVVEQLMACSAKECPNFYPRSSAKSRYEKTQDSSKRLEMIEEAKVEPTPMEGVEPTACSSPM